MPQETPDLFFAADPADSLFSVYSTRGCGDVTFRTFVLAKRASRFWWCQSLCGSGQPGNPMAGGVLASCHCPQLPACPCIFGSHVWLEWDSQYRRPYSLAWSQKLFWGFGMPSQEFLMAQAWIAASSIQPQYRAISFWKTIPTAYRRRLINQSFNQSDFASYIWSNIRRQEHQSSKTFDKKALILTFYVLNLSWKPSISFLIAIVHSFANVRFFNGLVMGNLTHSFSLR